MESLARSSLRWDAGYCTLMGIASAAFFKPVAEVIDAPRPLVAALGVGAIAWGGFVWILSRIPSWRAATTLIVVANLVAVIGIAIVVLVFDGPTSRSVVLGIVAIQVFAFAAIQAHALWSPLAR